MKRTKREQNAIVINFTLFLLLTLGVSYFGFSYIYPNMMQIEETKAQVKNTYDTIEKNKKTGIDFNDFKSVKSTIFSELESSEQASYAYKKSLAESISKDFYDENFINESAPNFDSFIVELQEKVQNFEENTNQKTKINFVLPSYVEDIADIETMNGDTDREGIHYLTDFRFINYIESIIDQFNLNYDNAIGINDITLVGDYAVSETGTTLDKNIYYIPVELDLTGQKRFVLLFLYYLEHVGNIEINEETKEIEILSPETLFTKEKAEKKEEINSDDFVVENEENQENAAEKIDEIDSETTVAEGIETENSIEEFEDNQKSEIYNSSMFEAIKFRRINDLPEKKESDEEKHNIFNNQIIDIETISFSEYIDANPSFGSLNEGNENNLLVNIAPQMRDEFSFKVKLRFYVKGLPKYKIEELIEQTKRFHTELTTEVTTLLGDPATVDYQKEQLLTINQTLKTLGEQLQPKGNKAETLTEKYNNSYQIKKLLKELEKQLERITN